MIMSKISDFKRKFEADDKPSEAPFLWNFGKESKMYTAVYHIADNMFIPTYNSSSPNTSQIEVIYITADLGQVQDDAKLKATEADIISRVLTEAGDNTVIEGNFVENGIAVSWAFNSW